MFKLDYWQAIDYYKAKKQAKNIHNIWINWHNDNSISAINELLKNKKYRIVSHLQFYLKYILKEDNYAKKIIDIKDFENSLNIPIVVWRGGEGKYKENYKYPKTWVSFTANKKRANTFSKYDGSYAQKVYKLDENDHYWIIELTIPLKDILLYCDVQDEEVIISTKNIKKARLIEEI